MPTSFLDLPVEIILLIAREQCSTDLNSLLQTNRYLHVLLTPALIDSVCRNRDRKYAKRALYSAAGSRNRPVTQQLLDRGIFNSTRRRRKLLLGAVSMENEGVAQTLMECGINPDGIYNQEGWTFLALAAAEGKATITRMVLERNDIYTNFPVGEGLTPLTAAIRAGKADTIKVLLDHPRTDVRVQDEGSGSLFHVAIMNCEQTCKSVIELLLADKRLNPNLMDPDGNTALHLSVRVPLHPATIPLLESDRVNKGLRNANGDTPLHTAIAFGSRHAVHHMLRHCPQLRLNSGHLAGGTPLHIAASCGDHDIVKALIEKPGVNINSQDRYGGTPLHWAAKQQREGVVTLLLERGASLDLPSHGGNTVAMLFETDSLTTKIRRIIGGYLLKDPLLMP